MQTNRLAGDSRASQKELPAATANKPGGGPSKAVSPGKKPTFAGALVAAAKKMKLRRRLLQISKPFFQPPCRPLSKAYNRRLFEVREGA